MKFALSIIFIFCVALVSAQTKTVINPPTGNRNTITHFADGVFADSIMLMRPVCGFPAISMTQYRAAKRWGALVLDSCNNIWYGYNPRTDEWSALSTAGTQCQNGLNVPGYVTWSGTGLGFDVSGPGLFTLDCITYDGNAGGITLDAADPTFPRFDVIAWDTTGDIVVIKGSAVANPVIPQIDPSSQIALAIINIPAGATTPGITQDVIYDENTEWTGAASGITVNLNNTVLPYHLLKSADAGTWSPTPKTLTFTRPTGTERFADWSILKLFIYLKAPIAGTGQMRLSFLHGSTVVSNVVNIGSGNGFNRALSGAYQNATVPMSSFLVTDSVFDKLRITFTGTGGGAYIDYIQLQAGLSPPNPAGTFVDTIYDRGDSLFYIKNNTEYLAQYQPMAKLLQQQFIIIYNADSSYDPYGLDVAIGVDTSALATYITTIINSDTTVVNPGSPTYIVDTVSNSPPVGAPSGYKVLVGEAGTGAFAGHDNDIATLVGAVWNFVDPSPQDIVQVSNSTQLLFYKFIGPPWVLISVPDLIGGMTGLTAPNIGTRDSNSFTIKTKNIPVLTATAAQDLLIHQYEGLEDSSIYFRPGLAGKVDTGYFSRLIAGAGITITPGLNRTDTISSTVGGSITASNGLTLTGSDVQLGGSLTQTTTIAAGSSFTLSLTGSRSAGNSILSINNGASTGNAIGVTGTISAGLNTSTVSRYPLRATNTLGTALNAEGSSTTIPVTIFRSNANGAIQPIALSLEGNNSSAEQFTGIAQQFKLYHESGAGNTVSNSMLSRWSNAPGTTGGIAEFVISGYNAGATNDVMSLLATGATKLNQYTTGNFYQNDTSSYKPIVVGSDGSLYRSSWLGGGGGGSFSPVAGGKSDIDSNIVYSGGVAKKASPLGYINIMDYGGINDSTGDNSTSITNAIAALPARGGVIYFPPGIYMVTSQIDVDKAVTFQGAGCGSYPDEIWIPSATKIVTPSSTLKVFYTTATNVKFYDLTIQNTATTPTEGAGIYAYEGHGMQIRSCMISGFYNNVQFVNGGEWTISDSYITGMVNAGIVVRDSITADDGDEAIVNCIIAARVRNAFYGVQWLSGGGLRLLNNKFNWGYEGVRIGIPVYCVFIDGQTGNGHFVNNSFENYTEHAIFIDPQETEFVGNLTIVSNQFQNLYAPSTRADIKLMTTMSGVSIVGNTFRTGTGADTAIYFDYNIFSIACANSYFGYDNPTIYSTNSVNSIFDNNKLAASFQLGEQTFANTATPKNFSMGGDVFNNNTPTGAGSKLRLYDVSASSNWCGFGVSGTSDFNMFGWSGNGWGYAQYVNNGTEAFRIKTTGLIQMAQYGAGTATFDASGNISSVSDERVKRNIHPYRTGLSELMKINPISYQYNGLSGNEVNGTYAGFSAQNVGANIPNSTGVTADGYLTLQDRALLATMVNAIKEQQAEIEELKKEIRRLKK